MEVCSPRQLPTGKKIWKVYVAAALAFGVATVVLAVALSSVLCQQAVGSMMAGNGSARLAWLEKELDVTNLSLAEARGQWEGCSKQLRVLEGKVLELEPALVRVTQLQEENGVLRAQVAQQEKQLEDLQSSRDELQLKNQALEKQLQDMRSQHSSGNRTPAVSLSLLALLLPGMLLL
ncbi:uncharacterized protein LOC116960357 isoform X2 [Tyto alba]|uniref:uncharacterized protein LOC116960357 isoform X2 n=1 Tax=Tyto alba TaxID=56313 RepID=UPI001C67C005|nr:uncharacterized protein LOC116960357 isoform X2 [Tyto alba]